jgi:hypothetical protein
MFPAQDSLIKPVELVGMHFMWLQIVRVAKAELLFSLGSPVLSSKWLPHRTVEVSSCVLS